MIQFGKGSKRLKISNRKLLLSIFRRKFQCGSFELSTNPIRLPQRKLCALICQGFLALRFLAFQGPRRDKLTTVRLGWLGSATYSRLLRKFEKNTTGRHFGLNPCSDSEPIHWFCTANSRFLVMQKMCRYG